MMQWSRWGPMDSYGYWELSLLWIRFPMDTMSCSSVDLVLLGWYLLGSRSTVPVSNLPVSFYYVLFATSSDIRHRHTAVTVVPHDNACTRN